MITSPHKDGAAASATKSESTPLLWNSAPPSRRSAGASKRNGDGLVRYWPPYQQQLSRQLRRRRRIIQVLTLCIALLIAGASIKPFLSPRHHQNLAGSAVDDGPSASSPSIHLEEHDSSTPLNAVHSSTPESLLKRVPQCKDGPCFRPERIQVPTDRVGFPSYWNYAGSQINVTYDGRSFFLNDDRVMFLGGSMHPARATLETWNAALDEAVRNGLNLVTVYVIWSVHQPFADRPIDWRLPNHIGCHRDSDGDDQDPYEYEYFGEDCAWTLARAIRAAANRGLFVHIRIGPYVCAEYSYGGIPEWLPLKYPDIRMRRANAEWLIAMEEYVANTVAYLTKNNLFAYMGGPIVAAQIENELGGEEEERDFFGSAAGSDGASPPIPPTNKKAGNNLLSVDAGGNLILNAPRRHYNKIGNATVQDYANWCGRLAARLAPQVVWTMCNGLSAPTTITSFNGDTTGSSWLEHRGDNGRVQVDQPALWTEDEGGFQIWGDDPKHVSNYFWGRTARDMAYNALQWFARGGSHLNYYMWWGGYNYGRSPAAGIMNMYAAEAPMCPSGERRQPKFAHFQSLHESIADIAPILLGAPTALFRNESVEFMNEHGSWQRSNGMDQKLFRYNTREGRHVHEAVFVENNVNRSHVMRAFLLNGTNERIFELQPYSAMLFVDGSVSFDSAALYPPSFKLTRKTRNDPVAMLDWASWREPVGSLWENPDTVVDTAPIEQTALLANMSMSSDYAWYGTDFTVPVDLEAAWLIVETQQANGLVAYIDDVYAGSSCTHHHAEGAAVLRIPLNVPITCGNHKISILSESLGYGNLIGRWGGSTGPKTKGITGGVFLSSPKLGYNVSLVDGRLWRSFAGLHGEKLSPKDGVRRQDLEKNLRGVSSSGGLWTSALFDTPRYDSSTQALFLDIKSGRGHIWLNGFDLGRFWNITRGNTSDYSQRYYFIPPDLLYLTGALNELVLYDIFGGGVGTPRLVLSWLEASDDQFEDEVGFQLACL